MRGELRRGEHECAGLVSLVSIYIMYLYPEGVGMGELSVRVPDIRDWAGFAWNFLVVKPWDSS